MRRNGGIIGVETTTSTSQASGVFDSFDVLNARKSSAWPTDVQPNIVSIEASSTEINEGESVTFTIRTTANFKNGSIFYDVEQVTGTITATDFDEPLTGELTVSDRETTLTLTTTEDFLTEGQESFKVNFRFTQGGDISKSSPVIDINDTSTTPSATIVPNVSEIDEGQTVTFTITTTGILNGILNWQINEVTGLITETDFVGGELSGTVQITNGSGTLELTAAEDTFDEGEESFTVSLEFERPDQSLVTIGTSSVVVINDTSTGGGPEVVALYDFTSFTFTNGTQTGRFGPSLQNLLSAYDTTANPWLNDTEFFNTSNGIQLWTVPEDGTYRIEAFGAGTDFVSNQRGARMRGDFVFEEGDVIRILVGQQGTNFRCGSGGTFVVKNTVGNPTTNDILVIAGGNGGYSTTNHAIMQGTTSNNGQNSVTSSGISAGGTNGGGGGQGGSCFAQSGAGFSGNGQGCDGTVAQSFLNGGVGASTSNNSGEGGFGGGGTGRSTTNWRIGGGGGYSGGASAGNLAGNAGGGGGSFNSGTNQSNSAGAHIGHGKVEITKL